MSGEKRRYVRIEESQLRQLQQQESRLRSLQQDLPQRLSAIRQQSQQAFLSRLAILESRAKREREFSQTLQGTLANLERETTRRLQQQQQDFQVALQQAQEREAMVRDRNLEMLETAMRFSFENQRREYLRMAEEHRKEYRQLIDDRDRQFQELLAEERQARSRGEKLIIQQFEGLVNRLESDKQQQVSLAQGLLKDVEAIWQQVEGEYQHERFAPGRLQQLRRGLEMASGNLEAGVTQAAIATTQQTYLELVDLRLELQQKEQEWLLLYEAATQDLRSLIAEVEANRQCELLVGEESESDRFEFEVDYWTNGALGEYERELSAIATELKEGENTLTRDRLQELGEKIEALKPQLGEIVERAKLAILSSQLRVEIADRVVEALAGLGYTLVDSDRDALYESGDRRQSYVVKVKNIAGDEVVTAIAPQTEFGANAISINSFSPTLIDETATQENAKAIFDYLEREGVKATGETECYEQAKTEYRDLQQLEQKKQGSNRQN